MVNLELYKIFTIVAKEQNITNASKKLNISQPAVTKHIKNLENLLDIKLFERTNKGLILTTLGNSLYEELKGPINILTNIDEKFSKTRNVNIGSHNHLLNIIFGKAINEYCLKYQNVNLNINNFETDVMLDMLEKYQLDIVFSKKIEKVKSKNIKYIKLGYLRDIFIVNKTSKFVQKVLKKEDFIKEKIYVPRTYAQTVKRLEDLMEGQILNLKNSSYNTILEIVSKTDSIGFITKEYIDQDKMEKFGLVEAKSEFSLQPVEFGVYLNDRSFKELNNLIEIIKQHFET